MFFAPIPGDGLTKNHFTAMQEFFYQFRGGGGEGRFESSSTKPLSGLGGDHPTTSKWEKDNLGK